MSAMDIDPDDGVPGPSQSNAARNAAAEELPSRTARAEQLHEERKERVTSGQAESERMKHVQAYWKQIDDIIQRGVDVQKAKEKIIAESIPEDVLVELGKAPVVNVQPVNRYKMLWKIMNEICDSAEIERVPSPSNITQDSSSAGIESPPPISAYPNNTNLPPSTPSPLPSNFYSDKLASPECSWTVDFLLRYLCYPYTTSPIHPALRESTGNPSNEVNPSQKGDLVLYGRFEGRKKEELLDLYKHLLYRRPILKIHLEGKLYALEKVPAGAVVWDSYFGVSLRTTAFSRLESDTSTVITPTKTSTKTPIMRRIEGGIDLFREVQAALSGKKSGYRTIDKDEFCDFLTEEDYEEENGPEEFIATAAFEPLPPPQAIASTSSAVSQLDIATPSVSFAPPLPTAFAAPDWHSYEFYQLRTHPDSVTIDGFEMGGDQVYMSCPYLWVAEYTLTTVGKGTAWNAAHGGAANLMERVTDTRVLEVVKRVASIRADSKPRTEQGGFPQTLSKDGVIRKHYARMVEHYAREADDRGRRQGPITDRATDLAAQMASNLDERGEGCLSVILAKDITQRDARGGSTWWNLAAGYGPKLWTYLMKVAIVGSEIWPSAFVTHDVSDRLSIAYWFGPFVDFWSVVVVHILIWIACMYMGRYLEIVRPIVIIVMSDKTSTLLRNGRFVLPNHRLVKEFVEMPATRTDTFLLRTIRSDLLKEEDKDLPEDRKPPPSPKSESSTPSPKPKPSPPTKPEAPPDYKPPSPTTPPDDEKPPSPTSPPTTPPPDDLDEIWDEIPEGDWILCICVIIIIKYGLGRSGISIQTLHPGYFKYNAALQPALLHLYLLTQTYTQLLLALAENVGNSPLNPVSAALLKGRVESKAEEIGLQGLVDDAKETVVRHSNALNGLAQLAPAGSPEAILERFERMSGKSRLGRAKYLARCERAMGEPQSRIRLEQINAMANDPTCKVGNSIFPKGSDTWKYKIDHLEKGKALQLSLDGSSVAERMSSVNNERLSRARQIKAERDAEHAPATCIIDVGFGPEEIPVNPNSFGIFICYSGCNLELDEIFTRIIDPRQAKADRFDADSSDQCLRVVRCVDCGTIAIVNLPNAHHWCRHRDWKKLPVAMGDSNNLSLERLLWPYQLLQYPDLESLFLSWLDNQEQTTIRRSSAGAHFTVTKLSGNPRLEDVFDHHQSGAQHKRRNEDAKDLKRAEVESKKHYVAMLAQMALL